MTELTDKEQVLLDELLKDFSADARAIFGEGGLLKTIGKRALKAALQEEKQVLGLWIAPTEEVLRG